MERGEAIEIVRKLYNESLFLKKDKEAMTTLIPELAESEDERMKKSVLKAFKIFAEKQAYIGHCLDDIDWDKCIAWLEKHIEKKLAEWSEDDEKIRKALLIHFKNELKRHGNVGLDYGIITTDVITWLIKQSKQSSLDTNQDYLKGIKRVQEYQDLSDWEKGFDDIASRYAYNKNQEGYNNSEYVKERAAEMLYHAKKELEKQGEQKSIEYPLCKTVKDKIDYYIVNHFTTDTVVKTDVNSIVKAMEEGVMIGMSEQKPAWSEEDSPYYDDICELLINILHSESRNYNMEAIKKDLDWLKSLRHQVSWKPSDDEMKALAEALSLANNCGEEYAFDLRTLYEQLKKLNG